MYIFEKDMDYVSSISSGKKAVLFLMRCFCSHDELVKMTLLGGNGKKAFSKPCHDGILRKCDILIEY